MTVYEIGEHEGRHYIVMPHLPGGTLADRLKASGPLTFVQASRVLEQVCAGLHAAHQAGLMHRDLKPANILFDAWGNAVVSDFGLARAVQLSSGPGSSTGNAGTPYYKAPELWRGKPPDSPATDVYALGCVLYEMLTGRVLFGATCPMKCWPNT